MSASRRQWLSSMATKASTTSHYLDMDTDFQFLGCDMDSEMVSSLYDFDSTFGPLEGLEGLEGFENQAESGSDSINGVMSSYQTIGDSFESNSTSPQSGSDFTTPCDNAYLSPYEAPLDADEQSFLQLTSTIRQLVHAKADTSPNYASNKVKRRDAAISLHLQLLKDSPVEESCFVSDSFVSGYSFDPCSEFLSCADSPVSRLNSSSMESSARGTKSPSTPSSSVCTSKPENQRPASRRTNGAVELVLDLNMNETASGPKKQKPRTQAQKESYIAARRNGACEKHRKQHKRCHCFDSVSPVSPRVSAVRKSRAQDRPSPTAVIQDRNNKTLQFVQASYEALEQATSTVAESVDTHLSLTETYTCLFPGCTFTSHTVPSLERHYSRHSTGSSPTFLSTTDTQPVRSYVLHTPQYVERPVRESSFSDTNAVSAPESISVHTQGGLPPRHLETHVIPHSSPTAGVPGVPGSRPQPDNSSSHTRMVPDSNNSGSRGGSEQYASPQELWRDRHTQPQKSVPLESPSEQNAAQDSRKTGGNTAITWLAKGYAEFVYSAFIAISFTWFLSAVSEWLQNFRTMSMVMLSSRLPHIHGHLV
ncbi:putative phosphoglycerate mutase pmu1 [Paecilomyces lecythidis]|uniref:Phosphoglycerate mutase pmu1 n=1 Tax=Paecilomyces lecythidis TaxID=3004212 RepID=A0ABR3WX45_9EURO